MLQEIINLCQSLIKSESVNGDVLIFIPTISELIFIFKELKIYLKMYQLSS